MKLHLRYVLPAAAYAMLLGFGGCGQSDPASPAERSESTVSIHAPDETASAEKHDSSAEPVSSKGPHQPLHPSYQNAMTAIDQQRWPQAIESLSQYIAEEPDDPWAYYNRAEAHRYSGQHANALADYNVSLKLDPVQAEFYHARGSFFLNRREVAQSIADLDRAIELNPGHVSALNNRGLIHLSRGELNAALGLLTRAITIDPDCHDARNNRGLVLLKQGQDALAATEFSRVLRIDEQHRSARRNRIVSLRNLERFRDALVDLDWLIERTPLSAELYEARRDVHLALDQTAQAEQDAKRLAWAKQMQAIQKDIRSGPPEATTFVRRAAHWWGGAQRQLAFADLESALRLDPDFTPALVLRADFHRRQNDIPAALADLDRAIRIESRPETLTARAELLRDGGRLFEAVRDFEAAGKFDAEMVTLYGELTAELQSAGRKALAETYGNRAEAMRRQLEQRVTPASYEATAPPFPEE